MVPLHNCVRDREFQHSLQISYSVRVPVFVCLSFPVKPLMSLHSDFAASVSHKNGAAMRRDVVRSMVPGTSGKTHFCAGQAFLDLTPDVR
jgi:hypothetical protein